MQKSGVNSILYFLIKSKMKKSLQKLLQTSLVFLMFLSIVPLQASAADGKSIGVRPLKNDIEIAPGATVTKTITVVNNTKEKIEAIPVLEVFLAADREGYPDQMKKGDPTNPQDATNWIKMSEDKVTVPPFSTYDVEYAVTAPENAEPGGHYAAILFEPYDPNPVEGIKIQVRVASLMLINVTGNRIEESEIMDFSLNSTKVYDDKPLIFNVELKNTGNVHYVPEGRIVLKNSKGEVIQKTGKVIDAEGQAQVYDYIPVNYKGGHLLPQSSRIFEGEWGQPLYNEKITAELKVAYSEIKELLSQTIEFTLSRALEVANFDFDLMKRNFNLVLKNKGNVLIKPVGAIKIYNSFDFQVDEIPLPEVAEDDYIKQGEERTYNFVWDKEVPSGRYKAVYVHAGTLDDIKSEPIKFIIGNPILAFLLSWQGAVALIALIIVIVSTILLIKRKNKKNNA